MKILNYLREFKKFFSSYQPLIEVLIYRENLLHNLKVFRHKYPHQQIAPVLKSNAYGHGLVPVAKILDGQKIAFLVVDSIFEAIVLRNEDIKSKILVIGYTKPQDIIRNRYKDISFALTSFAQLSEVSKKLKRKCRFHLKIDTGMHRQGILPGEIQKSKDKIQKNKRIILEGICSHFSSADSTDKNYCKLQISVWNEVVKRFKKDFPQIEYFHLAATGGSYYCGEKSKLNSDSSLQNTNVIRLGLGMYGIDPSPNRKLNLKPALELRTVISGIKNIQKGEYIGYGLTFKATNKMKVATIPAGYFEGIDRRLSNIGFYKIGEKFFPLVGRVSMNISEMDISKLNKAKVGDSVILISAIKNDLNSVNNIAKLCQTIPYEILVHIPQHLRRMVIV